MDYLKTKYWKKLYAGSIEKGITPFKNKKQSIEKHDENVG